MDGIGATPRTLLVEVHFGNVGHTESPGLGARCRDSCRHSANVAPDVPANSARNPGSLRITSKILLNDSSCRLWSLSRQRSIRSPHSRPFWGEALSGPGRRM